MFGWIQRLLDRSPSPTRQVPWVLVKDSVPPIGARASTHYQREDGTEHDVQVDWTS